MATSLGAVAGLLAVGLGRASRRGGLRPERQGLVGRRSSVKAPVVIPPDAEGEGGDDEQDASVAKAMRDEAELNRYRVEFAAENTEEWRPGRVVSVDEGASGTLVSLEVEASREFVALKNAYRGAGQQAQVRFSKDEDASTEAVPVASPPFSLAANNGQLWRLKGDIYAGTTKKEAVTKAANLTIEVLRPKDSPAVEPGDEVVVGPFIDDAIDLRPIMGLFQARAIGIFCDGSAEAVCHLRAALEAENCATELQLRERSFVMLFCGSAEGELPSTLSEWLSGAQERFGMAVSELDCDVDGEAWQSLAVPAIKRLEELGERLGALVLGSPSFVDSMSKRLSSEGVSLIAKSGNVHQLARVVEPEQI